MYVTILWWPVTILIVWCLRCWENVTVLKCMAHMRYHIHGEYKSKSNEREHTCAKWHRTEKHRYVLNLGSAACAWVLAHRRTRTWFKIRGFFLSVLQFIDNEYWNRLHVGNFAFLGRTSAMRQLRVVVVGWSLPSDGWIFVPLSRVWFRRLKFWRPL